MRLCSLVACHEQTITAVLVVNFSLLLHVRFEPYHRRELNNLETGALTAVLLTQVVSIMYLRVQSVDQDVDGSEVDDSESELATEIWVTILLAAVNICVVVVYVGWRSMLWLACGQAVHPNVCVHGRYLMSMLRAVRRANHENKLKQAAPNNPLRQARGARQSVGPASLTNAQSRGRPGTSSTRGGRRAGRRRMAAPLRGPRAGGNLPAVARASFTVARSSGADRKARPTRLGPPPRASVRGRRSTRLGMRPQHATRRPSSARASLALATIAMGFGTDGGGMGDDEGTTWRTNPMAASRRGRRASRAHT